jgi:hypothetical protein
MTKKQLIKAAADLVLVLAFCVFVYGLSLAWRPLGFIVGGLLAGAAAFYFGYSSVDFRSRN